MENKLGFCTFADLIDEYIDKVGITKCCGDILMLLANRLNDKARLIERVMKDNESDSIPSGANGKANPNPATPEEILSRNSAERAVPSCNLDGLTLVLEREYRK